MSIRISQQELDKTYTLFSINWAGSGVGGLGGRKKRRVCISINMSKFIRYFSQSDSSKKKRKFIFYLSKDVSLNENKS